MEKIISLIRNIKKNKEYELYYSSKYKTKKNFFKKEKIFMHRFIYDEHPDKSIYYYSNPHFWSKYISLYIPIISITKSCVLFDYEYYNNVYKTNNRARLINKKYGIDYFRIGMFDPDKEIKRYKKIELVCAFRF